MVFSYKYFKVTRVTTSDPESQILVTMS